MELFNDLAGGFMCSDSNMFPVDYKQSLELCGENVPQFHKSINVIEYQKYVTFLHPVKRANAGCMDFVAGVGPAALAMEIAPSIQLTLPANDADLPSSAQIGYVLTGSDHAPMTVNVPNFPLPTSSTVDADAKSNTCTNQS